MNGRTRITIGATVAMLIAAALALGGLSTDSESAAPAFAPPADAAAAELLAGFPAGDTAEQAQELERRVAANEQDAESLRLLGLAYQQRARETGDPSFLGRSEEALDRALAVEPDDAVATIGLASLAASRHDFRLALRLAGRAVRLDPASAAAHGIRGDALVELGRYPEAFAAFDRMAGLKPTLTSYTRVAYARELIGDTRGALAAMRLAVVAGGGAPEHAAWTLVQLGSLEFNRGRPDLAARAYRAARARVPGYVYATAGLARVRAARGDVDGAVAFYRQALERVPLPEFAAGLGETLRGAGREREAREVDDLVDTTETLLRANGVRTDLETALYDLDAGRRTRQALVAARAAYRERPSIVAEDALAWALFRNGRCDEARAHSVRALRLGTRDARMLFHRGMIERCLGHGAAARAAFADALDVNPYFSPRWAPVARRFVR